MAASRMPTIWALLIAHADGRGAVTTAADVCAVCVATVAVSGAAVTVSGAAARAAGQPEAAQAGTGHVICVTNDVSEQIEELQLTLGEGPRVDARAAGAPVLVADLDAADAVGRWPAFGPAARLAGVAALFAFPLQIGAIQVGVLDLYRRQPGPLSKEQLRDALLLADAATILLLERQAGAAGPGAGPGHRIGAVNGNGVVNGSVVTATNGGVDWYGSTETGPGGQPPELGQYRAEIDQATGMLTEQLGVTIEEAFVRLRAYAYAQDRRLVDVAHDLVARTLRLGPGDRRPGGAA
jgi:hypothetical protein